MTLFENKQTRLRFAAVVFSLVISASLFGQAMIQNISGKVIDKESKQALCGAELIIKNSDPLIIVKTDEQGNFKFDKIPHGKYFIQVSYPEYKEKKTYKIDIYSNDVAVFIFELSKIDTDKSNKGKWSFKTKRKEPITGIP